MDEGEGGEEHDYERMGYGKNHKSIWNRVPTCCIGGQYCYTIVHNHSRQMEEDLDVDPTLLISTIIEECL